MHIYIKARESKDLNPFAFEQGSVMKGKYHEIQGLEFKNGKI